MSNLFRSEALVHAKQKHMGSVFMNIPLPYVPAMIGCGLLMLALILFVMLGEYAEQWTMKGYIDVAQGMIQVYPRTSGVIKKSYVKEGDHVRPGDMLFRLDTVDGQGSDKNHHAIEASFLKRKRALEEELFHKQQYLEKLKPLLHKKYISILFYDEKRSEIVGLNNQLHQLEIEIIRNKQTRTAVIKAPKKGVVSNVMIYKGQSVKLDKPLASILPEHARYVAQLYLPVSQAGFLKEKKIITVHYDAYPYQRFGSGKGVVDAVAHTILTDKDEDKPIDIKQPYYKAIASLDKSYVWVEGKPRYLQQGMTFTAVVLGSKKKIWQWLFDSLWRHQQEPLR